MKKTLTAGVVGLLMFSGAALADEYSSTVTTQTNSDNPGVVSTTRVAKSVGTEDGMLTQKTDVYRSVAPAPLPVPSPQSTTTIERTTTTTTAPSDQ
jgi:hypothetical protein